MAEAVYLWLTINGTDIEGELRTRAKGVQGSIECSAFHYGLAQPYGAHDGVVTGRPQHEPVRIHKRVDKSTPHLLRALCEKERVDSAEFRFYRPDSAGAMENFYTVKLKNGRIVAVRQTSEDVIMASRDAPPMMEEVVFVFQDIEWTFVPGAVTHTDSWA